MVTIAFGQVFYFIAFRWNSVTGVTTGCGLRAPALDLRLRGASTFCTTPSVLLPGLSRCSLSRVGSWRSCCVHHSGARCSPSVKTSAARASLVFRSNATSGFRSISCSFVSLAGTLYALLNNFADPHELYWTQSGDFVIMAVLGGMRSLLGPAARGRDLCRTPGLLVEPDDELDVLPWAVLRAYRPVLSHAACLGAFRRNGDT